MKINSLKLTIQDMPDKEGKLFAAVYGTLILDTGEVKQDKDGKPVVDKEGVLIPILENINFITPLNSSKELKACVQALAVEALTLKNMEIAKKEGQLSHFVQAIEGVQDGLTDADKKSRKRGPEPIPVPRRKRGK